MTPKEGVCLYLVELRQKLTFEILGLLFDLWRTKANSTFNYCVEILREILPISQIKEAKKDEWKYQELSEVLSEYELLIDSAEEAIERPGNYQEQKKIIQARRKYTL